MTPDAVKNGPAARTLGLRRNAGRRKAAGHLSPGRFFHLIDAISRWCGDRRPRIADCYLVPGPNHVGVYVVTTAEAFDFDLNKELTDFSSALVRKGLPVHASLLPHCTEEEFSQTEQIDPHVGVYKLV